jgi:2-polyprenyl-6-hydroxyphenyl methylase/3-demethylubiquinone-9 3-methyltransferase
VQSLDSLFGEGTLQGKQFLDIGCGSGLFSIAAARSGARSVTGIDADPVSVQVSRENAAHWLPAASPVLFELVSVLDQAQMMELGQFDVVYSWGVLHHTGDMALALSNTVRAVKPNGLLMIAIYNRHWSSRPWKTIKHFYNYAGAIGQKLIIGLLTPVIVLAKWLATFQNPFHVRRGMDFMHNVIDWVGGFPYEYAGIDDMIGSLEALGFEVLLVRPATVPTGCNEFVCRRKEETG